MARHKGPKITTRGLIFAVDINNPQSYDSESAPLDVVNIVDPSITGSLKNGVLIENGGWGFTNNTEIIDFGTSLGDVLGNSNTGVSVELWVYRNSTPNAGYFSFTNYVNSHGEFETKSVNTVYNLAMNSAVTLITTPTAFPVNNWDHVVCTYDGVNGSLYVNSVLEKEGADATALNFIGLKFILGGYYGTPYSMDGQIKACNVYNTTLTSDEIKQNYNSMKSKYI